MCKTKLKKQTRLTHTDKRAVTLGKAYKVRALVEVQMGMREFERVVKEYYFNERPSKQAAEATIAGDGISVGWNIVNLANLK